MHYVLYPYKITRVPHNFASKNVYIHLGLKHVNIRIKTSCTKWFNFMPLSSIMPTYKKQQKGISTKHGWQTFRMLALIKSIFFIIWNLIVFLYCLFICIFCYYAFLTYLCRTMSPVLVNFYDDSQLDVTTRT